jgi:hypothetical protein
VIDTGRHKIIYRVLDNGSFEQTTIHTGGSGKDAIPVLEGLSEGDRVVTNGAFLLDSEARLTGTAHSADRPGSHTNAASTKDQITLGIKPDPPVKGAANTVSVKVMDASGVSNPDLQVQISISMPAMPSMGMPELRRASDLKWTGSEYSGTIDVAMAGHWNVVVDARRGSQLIASYRTNFNAH